MNIVKTQAVVLIVIFNLLLFNISAQELQILVEKEGVSLRGLSVVSDKTIWASGNNGTFARSVDGGKTWSWNQVAGFESRDFRDIEAFDELTAIIMAAGEPAVILKTTNGGNTWKKVYENNTQGMFLDAMEFSSDNNGMVIGDPVNGRFFIAHTNNAGNTWKQNKNLPAAATGEACFAASGTNLRISGNNNYFVTGGTTSRLFIDNKPVQLPVLQGKESQGANSVAVSAKNIIVVGGDFAADTFRVGNSIISRDGGITWIKPSSLPYGYRSCVEFVDKKRAVTCGTNGVDVSSDAGVHWNSVSATGFHVCRRAKKGSSVYLAGGNGRIARLLW